MKSRTATAVMTEFPAADYLLSCHNNSMDLEHCPPPPQQSTSKALCWGGVQRDSAPVDDRGAKVKLVSK